MNDIFSGLPPTPLQWAGYSAGEALISSETFAALLARSKGSRSLGWMSTPSLAPPPPAVKPRPPLGAYRPCRHNHHTATIGSQKLALIYMEPWDGLRLSVHQSVRGSRLDRTQAALVLSYRLRQTGPRFLIGLQRRPVGPSCCLTSWLIC